jgi:hypothetical protein
MPTRRRVLTGLGATVAATGGVLGSGAFGTASATRSTSISVVGTDAGRLPFTPTSPYVDDDGLQMDVVVKKLNKQSVTTFEGLFEITNAGNAPMDLELTDSFAEAVSFKFGATGERSTSLESGASASVSLEIDTRGVATNELGDGKLTVEATEAAQT